jgi:acyl-coenzyme A thioesterase PaaI-like protein
MQILHTRLGKRVADFLIPPPIFKMMEGEFVEFNSEQGWLTARFPIRDEYLNPYHTMQGGMIAAAIDNTLGPLSMLVAPPNVTRTLEIKYSRPVLVDQGYIIVHAQFSRREGQMLHFNVEVRSVQGVLCCRAKAKHWILEPSES